MDRQEGKNFVNITALEGRAEPSKLSVCMLVCVFLESNIFKTFYHMKYLLYAHVERIMP